MTCDSHVKVRLSKAHQHDSQNIVSMIEPSVPVLASTSLCVATQGLANGFSEAQAV